MINQLKKIDGVMAVVVFTEGPKPAPMTVLGELPLDEAKRLSRFANDYMRLLQGLIDQFAMLTPSRQWVLVNGWAVHGPRFSVYGWGNLVCIVDNSKVNHNMIKLVKDTFLNM